MEPANVSPTVPGRLVKMKVCSCLPPSLTSKGSVSNSWAVTAELTSAVEGVSNGGRRIHFDGLRCAANFQHEIDGDDLRDRHQDLVGHMRFEALLLGLQAIRSRRQGNAVIAGAAGGGGPFHAGVNVLNRERQIGNDASACILYCPGYCSETALPADELASSQK